MAAKRTDHVDDVDLVRLPTSAVTAPQPVLHFLEKGMYIVGVPARDLYEADINELADAWEKDPGIVAAELRASRLYEE